MKISESYINWYENASDDDRGSTINHVIYTCSSLDLKDRIMIAIEIILGERFCLWISRKQ